MFEQVPTAKSGRTAGWARLRRSRLPERLGFAVAILLLLTFGVSPHHSAPPAPWPDGRGASPAFAYAAVHTAGDPLNERSGPSTYHTIVGQLADGATVGLLCQIYGEQLTGAVTTSSWWEVDADGSYVSDSWLDWRPTRPAMPWCGVNTHRAVTATVHTHGDATLSIRKGPRTADAEIGSLATGTPLTVLCRTWGDTIDGAGGKTAAWDELPTGGYVADALVHWAPEQPFMPWCGEAPESVPPASTKVFISTAVAMARVTMVKYNVPASVTIAQAILESGTGASTLTRVDHNVFGMKCFGNPGTIAIGCRDYATHECDTKGHCYATTASFRVYRTDADSFADHGLLLGATSRYKPALDFGAVPAQFAKALQTAGYATSTTYATNLINLMNKYDLHQYDDIGRVAS